VNDVVERVRAAADRVAASYGLEIFDIQFRREGRSMVLRIRIDRPWNESHESHDGHEQDEGDERPERSGAPEEGISIEDCASVSRDLSAILDVEDAVPGAYTLEVSSPGLDRPLRSAADYRRFSGRRAKLVMREAVDGHAFFKGRLAGMDGDRAVVDTDDGRRHLVPIGVITRANLEVEF
jgi:ribosome maturation factor RimP